MSDDGITRPVYDSFVRALFTSHPEWRGLSRDKGTPQSGPSLLVEVPAPAEARVEQGLEIEVDEEITVGFDWWHEHYGPGIRYQAAPGDEEGLTAAEVALHRIDEILAERLAVVSYWAGDEWCGSSLMLAEESPRTDGMVASVVGAGAPPFSRVRVRSWKGTLNADINRPGA